MFKFFALEFVERLTKQKINVKKGQSLSHQTRNPEPMGHEADHSFAFNVEVKNAWSYTSTHPYAVMASTTIPFP